MSTPEISAEEEALYEMSDEELDAAFKAAKAERDTPMMDEEVDESADTEVGDEDTEEVELDEESEEEESEAMEQPEEDSDSDDDTDDEVDNEEEDDSETDEGDLDGEPEEEEEQPKESEEKAEEEVQPVQPIKVKANGRDYEFTNDEIVAQFPTLFGQAMDYTKKMQALKPWRKTIDAWQQEKLSQDDVNLAIDVLKGNKEAIASVIKRAGIDTLELETDRELAYTPNDYGRDSTALELDDVVSKISGDREYETTHRVLSKEWDDSSWNAMSKDPTLIEALHVDVKNGTYDKVQSIADKIKLQDRGRGTDLDYYREAGNIYYSQQAQQKAETDRLTKLEADRKAEADRAEEKQREIDKVKKEQAKRTKTAKAANKRKAAAPTKKAAGNKGVVDYLDDSDEAFDDWYKSLQASI